MKTQLLIAPLFCLCLLFTSCGKDKEPPELITLFHVQVSQNMPAPWSTSGNLPISGTEIYYNPNPIIYEGDVVDVNAFQNQLGTFVGFQLSERGAKELFRATQANLGKRIYLVVNGQPIGHHKIERAINNGMLYMWLEVPDDQFMEFVEKLKESAYRAQAIKNE